VRVVNALGVTFALMVMVAFIPAEPWFGLLVLLVSAIWAAADSSRLELHKYRGGTSHPIFVFLAVFFLWIVCFPLYLVTRSRYLDGELKLKKRYREDVAAALDDDREG
jgi:hypothetical protein